MANQFIEEMSEVAGVDFRADVPPGTELGREEIAPGAQAVFHKSRSGVHAGGHPLPERVDLYDLHTHDHSKVPPTIAQKRMMTYPGRYTMKRPATWTDPTPIDDTCMLCTERRAQESGAGPKKFYSEWDLIQHYRLMHTLEWEAIESDRKDKERREEQSTMRTLVASIAAMVNKGVDVPQEIREQIADLEARDEAQIVAEPPKRRPGRPRKDK